MSKLTLVGFSRRHVPDPAWLGRMMLEACPAFTTCGTTIEAVLSHKFLRVIFDQELWWSEQVERVTAKATKWSLCTQQFTRLVTGVSPQQMQQLYQAVAVPSYTYAADVWFNPVIRNTSNKKAKGLVSMACKLTSVQCIVTTAITGTLHTSATDTMELHANLFPVELMQRV